jgi:hypothetical protein
MVYRSTQGNREERGCIAASRAELELDIVLEFFRIFRTYVATVIHTITIEEDSLYKRACEVIRSLCRRILV